MQYRMADLVMITLLNTIDYWLYTEALGFLYSASPVSEVCASQARLRNSTRLYTVYSLENVVYIFTKQSLSYTSQQSP